MYNPNEAKIIRESSCGYHLIPIQDEMLSHREVELVGEVDADSANALIRQLRYLQREDPGAWVTLYINSPGGSVDSGMALYDVMQAVSCPIRTVCVGLAASMAALLFVSGAERGMLPHSRLMIHDPLIVQTGGSALKLKAVSDDLMETRQIIARVIAEHSGKSMDEVLAKTASDSYFRAEEAIEFGLADQIITGLSDGE
ncbi:MAG: ATP-dependent Clp protease proteolytic subunit [Lachnospiraceae bacterium]|jgi:ATP-dependent Clp protease protease subunit|nr:ATP-dependent Clp protease proteolytic subunit [Lachnospiraceae bacterium]MCI9601933.1 ATP-dependent Clp protease proteolytic subunit [Lachnospiraceae bacterium]MDE6895940.1 ATP-dependent Clp protease proteolytic subunit [Lachnospiraceae bacterium]